MRSPLLTALLLSASTAFAQVRVVGELAVPPAPAVSGASAINASPLATLPALSLTPAVLTPTLAPVAAPAPISILVQTGASLSAPSKEDPSSISRRTFDAGAKTPKSEAEPVAAHESSPVPLEHFDTTRFLKPVDGPVRKAAWETAETAAVAIPFAVGALVVRGAFSNPVLLTAAMLGLWSLGFWIMRDNLARLRSTVVGGWQASHDQKYRTDPSTGQLKDIRGHKYGSDRYEEYAKGPVGRTATALLAAAALGGAAAFLLL
jgi:hypothetical protein